MAPFDSNKARIRVMKIVIEDSIWVEYEPKLLLRKMSKTNVNTEFDLSHYY